MRAAAALGSLLLATSAAAGGKPVTAQYFRFTPRAVRNTPVQADSVQVSEIVFKDTKGNKVDSGETATNPLGNNPENQGPDKLVDGNYDTKWLDFQKSFVVIDFGSARELASFTYVTGNDSPERDPIEFAMESSMDGQTNWVTCVNITGFVPTDTREVEQVYWYMGEVGPGGSATTGGGGDGGGSSEGCAGGCIFVIAFFVGGFVYFAAGFAYNHQRRELRGVEAIPHVEFWKDLPFLVKDGGVFVFRKATGGSGYTTV